MAARVKKDPGPAIRIGVLAEVSMKGGKFELGSLQKAINRSDLPDECKGCPVVGRLAEFQVDNVYRRNGDGSCLKDVIRGNVPGVELGCAKDRRAVKGCRVFQLLNASLDANHQLDST